MSRKKLIVIFCASIVFVTFLIVPTAAVHAQNYVQTGLQNVGNQIGSGNTGLFSPTDSVSDVIGKVVEILLGLSGAIAVLFVIIGGFLYLTSAGNEEQASKGRKDITYALIGLSIIILSYIIVNVIVNLIQNGIV